MSAMSAHFRPPDGECWLRIKHSLWSMTLTPLFASWLRTNDFQTIDHIEVDGILLEPIAGEKKMLNYSDCGRDLLDSSGWFLPPEWGTDGLYKGLILGIMSDLDVELCEDTSTSTCLNIGNIGILSAHLCVFVLSATDLASLAWTASTMFHDWSLFQGGDVEIP